MELQLTGMQEVNEMELNDVTGGMSTSDGVGLGLSIFGALVAGYMTFGVATAAWGAAEGTAAAAKVIVGAAVKIGGAAAAGYYVGKGAAKAFGAGDQGERHGKDGSPGSDIIG